MRRALVIGIGALTITGLAIFACESSAERHDGSDAPLGDPDGDHGPAASEPVRRRVAPTDAGARSAEGPGPTTSQQAGSAAKPVVSIAGARRSLLHSLEECDRVWEDDPERHAERIATLRAVVLEAAAERSVELWANAEAAKLRIDGLRALLEMAETTEDDGVRALAFYTMWYMPARLVRTPDGQRALAGVLDYVSRAPADENVRGNLRVGFLALVSLAGPDAARHADAFSALARDDDPWKRRMGVGAIARLGRFGGDAHPALLERAYDADPEIRRAVASALLGSRIGGDASTPALLALALDDDDVTRRNAAFALRVRHPAIVEDRLLPLARHADPNVRRAAYELGYPRPDSEPAPEVPPNGDERNDPPPPPQPVEGLDSVTLLIRALDSRGDRRFAFHRLTQLGPAARAAIPHLLRIIEEGQHTRAAIDTLSAVAADDPLLVSELIFLLEGGARQQRRSSHSWRDSGERHAARALGRLGARAEAALPALRLATLAGSRQLREESALATERIESALDR